MDIAMNKELKKVYYDPSNPASYSGLTKFYNAVKHRGYKKTQVKKWLQKQDVYTLHKQLSRNVKRPKVVVSAVDQLWDGDTMSMVKYRAHNKNFSYILVLIDIFTRYAWTLPLKSLKGREMVTSLQLIFKTNKPVKIRTDSGSEFKNRSVHALLEEEKVYHFTTTNEVKSNFAERIIQNLKKKIMKIMYERNSDTWIDLLKPVTDSYNASFHRSIKMTPSQARTTDPVELWNNQYKRKKKIRNSHPPNQRKLFKFNVEDKVRLARFRSTFERAYSEKWTDEIFIITKREVQQYIAQYTIKSWDNEPIIGKFYEEELELVHVDESSEHSIEKIIQKKTMDKKPGYIVKWEGWPAQFNSWVPSNKVAESGIEI